MNPERLRTALGAFATGITIVTTRDSTGRDVGLTVNSFNSVSLDPPLVLWSLAKKSGSRQAFIDATHFAVHVLAADQSEIATRFASPTDRFAGLQLQRAAHGSPLLEGCAARFECRTAFRHDGGDHDIFVGEVIDFEHFDRPALVFLSGRFALAVAKSGPSDEPDGAAADLGRNGLEYLLARTYFQLRIGTRPLLARLNLSEPEFSSLATLALHGPSSVPEIVDMIGTTGQVVTPQDIQRLVQRNLVEVTNAAGASQQVRISNEGRDIVLRIASVAKAVEASAVSELTYAEVDILKQMLRTIMRRTRAPWQKSPLVVR